VLEKKKYKSPMIINSNERGLLPIVSAVAFVAGAAAAKSVVSSVARAIGDNFQGTFPRMLAIVEENA
jgi:hypothetical protein